MKKIVCYFLLSCLMNYSSNCLASSVDIMGLDGRSGSYNPSDRTASLGKHGYTTLYTDIVEYSQAVTPPNIENPKLQQFATMQNPRYKKGKPLMGGQKKTITLYGIPQYSTDVNESSIAFIEPERDKQQSFVIYGSQGSYNRTAKTAYLIDVSGKRIEYTNIVEYSRTQTPPSVENPKLEPFAKMSNPKYKEVDGRLSGGQMRYIILYGIKREPIDEDSLEAI
ncbi:hypothetical protein HYV10_02665 [Candidatus Dependentiae bacterium]|nr:hypothetical protein [Candidatus Dependentiae bacterium]